MCAQLDSLLIAGQDTPDIDALSEALEDASHQVTRIDASRLVLDQLRTTGVDLVFVQIDAPGVDAWEVIDHFKSGEGWPKPLVILVGREETETIRRLFDHGADDFLRIPIHVPRLEARSSSWVERKQLYELHRNYQDQIRGEKQRSDDLLKVVIPLGVALSAEKDFNRLLEMILLQAKDLCNADAGTLYLRTGQNTLQFVIVRNDSLGLALGGTTGKPITFPALPIIDPATGEPNHKNVATHAAISRSTINILDAYEAQGFDFSGTRKFDGETGYRSISFLTTPLKENDEVLGVLQLINARDPETGRVTHFDTRIHPVIESLTLLASVAMRAYIREENLKARIEQLQIQVDEVRKARQVTEIVESDYFQSLQQRARELRQKSRDSGSSEDADS